MERTEEALRERVRETPLSERLKTCEKYIASMCAERRPPKMTIPLQHYDEDFYICTTLADAQATIAALQARVKELERDQNAACAVAKTFEQMNDENTLRRIIEKLQVDLSQRTAELEAANKLLYKKNCALGRAETSINDLQAELERVRGELAETKEVEAALSSKVAEYEVELNGDPQNFYGRGRAVGLRTLIAALPKVEGEIVAQGGYVKDRKKVYACFGADADMKTYAALLRERQQMKGGEHE